MSSQNAFVQRSAGRTRSRILRASVISLVLLASCGTQRTPSSYTSSVRKNFQRSCESRARTDKVSNGKSICTCSFTEFKKSISFDRFKEVNSDLTEDPRPLPSDMLEIVANCRAKAAEPAPTTRSDPTTTR